MVGKVIITHAGGYGPDLGKGSEGGEGNKGDVDPTLPTTSLNTRCQYEQCSVGSFVPSKKNRTRNVQRFCNSACRVAQYSLEKYGKRKGEKGEPVECGYELCKEVFTPDKVRSKFHSGECRVAQYKLERKGIGGGDAVAE